MLTEQQQQAFDQIVGSIEKGENHVLTGYAGTGKTFLSQQLSKKYPNAIFCAPTNKAAKVLQDNIGKKAYTVHQILCLRLDKGKLMSYAKPNLTGIQAVFVDECSMIQEFIFNMLLDRVATQCPVIFIGDPAQLPPVKEGGISKTFNIKNKSALNTIVRQADGSPIIKLASDIREGKFKANMLAGYVKTSGGVLEVKKISTAIDSALAYKDVTDSGIVTGWTNAFCDDVNWQAHYKKYGKGCYDFMVGQQVFLQTPLLMSDKTLAATNGDLLTIKSITPKKETVYNIPDVPHWVISFEEVDAEAKVVALVAQAWFNTGLAKLAEQERWQQFWALKEYFTELKHTYAATTHKLQGSTYDEISINILDIFKNRNPEERDKCLYVAVTRARNKVTFLLP